MCISGGCSEITADKEQIERVHSPGLDQLTLKFKGLPRGPDGGRFYTSKIAKPVRKKNE